MAWIKVDKKTSSWTQSTTNQEYLTRSDNLGENGVLIGGNDGLYLNLSDDYFDRLDGYIIETNWGHTSSGGTSWDTVTVVDTNFERA
jgi:hypothetical protein